MDIHWPQPDQIFSDPGLPVTWRRRTPRCGCRPAGVVSFGPAGFITVSTATRQRNAGPQLAEVRPAV